MHVVLELVSVFVGSAVLVNVGGLVMGGSEVWCFEVEVGSSLHPHHPGVKQVVEVGSCVFLWVVVVAGAVVCVLVVVVVLLSLHPNQPGVSQLCVVVKDVVVVGADVVVTAPDVVVDSSRQPHHPGVLHVSVLVLILLVVVVLEVTGAELLLS